MIRKSGIFLFNAFAGRLVCYRKHIFAHARATQVAKDERREWKMPTTTATTIHRTVTIKTVDEETVLYSIGNTAIKNTDTIYPGMTVLMKNSRTYAQRLLTFMERPTRDATGKWEALTYNVKTGERKRHNLADMGITQHIHEDGALSWQRDVKCYLARKL